jgi:hypothetical protein
MLVGDKLKNFMESNPQFEYEFVQHRGRHPYISALYVNGFIKDLPVKDSSEQQIIDSLVKFRNSCMLL